jgi:hypothetical protein
VLKLSNLSGFGGRAYTGSMSFIGSTKVTNDATTYTFAGQSLGAAGDRLVVVVGHTLDSAFNQVSSVTIAGVAATIHVNNTRSGTSDCCLFIASAYVPSGTSGDIVVTWQSSTFRCTIGVWALYNLQSKSPRATVAPASADPVDLSLAVPAGGFVVAGATSLDATGFTWTGLTERYDATGETSNERFGHADGAFPQGGTPALEVNPTGPTITAAGAASWY